MITFIYALIMFVKDEPRLWILLMVELALEFWLLSVLGSKIPSLHDAEDPTRVSEEWKKEQMVREGKS